MQIMVNGKSVAIPGGNETVAALLQRLGYSGETFAVALNGDFVARTTYAEISLGDGDILDIVAPVVGG